MCLIIRDSSTEAFTYTMSHTISATLFFTSVFLFLLIILFHYFIEIRLHVLLLFLKEKSLVETECVL